MSPDVERTLLC